ncbi:MAG: hypothetical protein ACI4A5_01595 [Hominilimicola sp.]
MKRHAVLKRGEIYNNKYGGRYKCLDAYENGDAKMINIDSGWCFDANCVTLYDDGTIEWDFSTHGKFVNKGEYI